MTAVTLMVTLAVLLVPPSPSVTVKLAVRAVTLGSWEALSKVTLRASASAAVGVALALKVTTRSAPPVPPVAVPISVPA